MSIIDLQRRVSRLVPPDSPAERYAEMERIAALLTPDQRMQAADLRARIDEVGIEGADGRRACDRRRDPSRAARDRGTRPMSYADLNRRLSFIGDGSPERLPGLPGPAGTERAPA